MATPLEIVNEKDHHVQEKVKEALCNKSVSRIIIELYNGLQITHRTIDYRTLCRLVEKIATILLLPNNEIENK